MGKIKNKLIDWKNRLQDRHMLSIIVVLVSILIIMDKHLKIHIIWHFLN